MKMTRRAVYFLLAVVSFCMGGEMVAAPPISYAGGDGSSIEKAVIIKGGDEESGVQAEYTYLARHFPGYKMGQQSVSSKGKHSYDTLEFTTAKGEKKTIYFDITAFFGKVD